MNCCPIKQIRFHLRTTSSHAYRDNAHWWFMIHDTHLMPAINLSHECAFMSQLESNNRFIHPSILILVIIYYRSNQQTYIFCLWKWFEANFFQQQIKNKQNNVLRVIIGFSRLLWLTPPEMEYCADSGHTHTFHINCLCFSNEITMLRAMVEFPRKKKIGSFVRPPFHIIIIISIKVATFAKAMMPKYHRLWSRNI